MRYFLTVSLLAFFLTSFSQIPYNTFAEVKTPNPWDGRDSLTTLADTASYETNIKYPGLLAYAYDVSQLWMWNGTKWVFLFDETGSPNTNIAVDTAVQLTYLPSHNYTDGLLYAIKADFTRASAEFADSIHTAFIVGAPDVDSVQIQYAGRYTQTGHGYAVGKLYYLTDDTADQFDTIPGSFTDPVFIVLDTNTLELLNQGTDVNSNIIRRVIPSPFITAFGGDPFAPTDSVIQAVIEGVYVPTGRAAPGTIFLTQNTGASRNPAHVASAADPSTPANMWYWDGALATRNNYAQQSISLSDTAYGTLFNIPLDTVQLIGGIPTDSTVADWLETNYTDNNLRVPNGTLLYWVGSGTKRSPDYVWQVVDDLTPEAVGTDQWDNIIKKISSPGGAESSGLVGELQYSDGSGGFTSNDKITHNSNVISLDNDDDSGDVSLTIHNFDAGTGLLGDELDWNVTIQNGFTYRTRGTDNATLYTSSRSYTADNTDPNQVIGQWVVQSYNNSGLLNTNAGGFRFLNIDQTNSYSNFHLWGKSTLDKELIYTGETGALKLEGYADAGISTTGTYSRLLAVQTDGSVVPITAPSGADGNGIYDGSDELPGIRVDVDNTAGLRIVDPGYTGNYSEFYNDFDNPIFDESFHTGLIIADGNEFEDTVAVGFNQNGFELYSPIGSSPISIRTVGNYAGLFGDSVSLRIGVNGIGGKQNILQDNSANKRGLEYYGYGENVSTGAGGNYDDVLTRPNALPPVAAVAEMISDSLSGFSGSSGDVVGPASSTDNAVPRFDGTGGKTLQGSGVTIDDSGNIALPGSVDGRFIAEDGDILDDHADTLIVHDNRLVALEQNANIVDDSIAALRTDIDSKGDLSGPVSSTDNRIATFDGITGKLIQQSGISIDGTNITASSPISILDSNYLSSFARIYMNYDSPLAILNGYDMEQGLHFYNSEEDINWYLGANYDGVYFQGETALVTYFPDYNFERDSLKFIIDANGHFFESTKAIPLPPHVRGYGETALNNYQDGDYEHVLQYNDVLAPIGAVRLLDTVTTLSNDTIFYKVLGETVGFDVLPAGSGSDDGVVDGGSVGDILQELTLTRTVGADVDIDISSLVFESELTTNTGAIATQIEAEEGSVTTVRRFTPERIAQAIGALETSLAHILPIADYTVFAAGHDFRILTADQITFQGTGTVSFGDGINTFHQFSNATGSVNFTPPTSVIMNTPLVSFQNNISETYRVTFDNMRLEEIAPGYEGQDATNKNQLDSLITAFQEITDSTSITVNLEGKHNKIVRIDMTGVSNAGTITLQSPLNPYSSATEVGVYTFHITNANTHNFDFPASFVDIEGTAYDASSTVEIVSALMFTCYYDGTNYICQ